jgi:hypothetical protein
MTWNSKETNQQKHQFRSYYCAGCKQTKPCGVLTSWSNEWRSYCCSCYYESEQQKAQEHSNYQQVFQQKVRERKENLQRLGLLKDYFGCSRCGSKEADAYSLYSENKLVCRPCLVKKTGGGSSPISFSEQQKWYKKSWGIDLKEWLEKFSQLPVNKKCAERHKPSAKQKWKGNKEHLNKCDCLELEAKESYLLFNSSLKKMEELLKKCSCEKSEKFRVSSDDYAWCEKCEKTISVASKKRVIRNRNDPRFWGLEVEEKILCLDCLEKFQGQMPISKQYTFNKYLKRYWKK